MSLVADLQGAVQHRARRLHGGGRTLYERTAAALERADFDEQFSLAEDDAERITICQRWLNSYRSISNAERSTARPFTVRS